MHTIPTPCTPFTSLLPGAHRFVSAIRLSHWDPFIPLALAPASSSSTPASSSPASPPPLGTPSRTPSPSDRGRGRVGVNGVGGAGAGDAALQLWQCEPPHPDLSSCLLHQKLQMLQLCIHR